jgi:hypothetical protein
MQKGFIVLRRRYRALLWCLALSLAFHFLVVPLIVSLFGYDRRVETVKEVVYYAKSSSLNVTRRPRPRPHSMPHPRTVPQPRPQPKAQAAPPPRREIARIEPRAHISVPRVSSRSSSTTDFAQQQSLFEKTIAQLRRESNPLLSAAKPVETPGAPKRYTYDFSGAFGSNAGNGILSPVTQWHDGPYDYYYVRYWVQYADGAVETGYVPWPLRYLPKDDPFRNHWEHFPLPKPLPDYKLPPGTNLHPLIAFCLEHLKELESCPPEHD